MHPFMHCAPKENSLLRSELAQLTWIASLQYTDRNLFVSLTWVFSLYCRIMPTDILDFQVINVKLNTLTQSVSSFFTLLINKWFKYRNKFSTLWKKKCDRLAKGNPSAGKIVGEACPLLQGCKWRVLDPLNNTSENWILKNKKIQKNFFRK